MQKSKLIRLLAFFSNSELDRLKLFVQSPFFNTNQHLLSLLEYLLPFKPTFRHEEMDEKRAFKHIFPEVPFSADSKKVIIKLSSKLLKLAEQFIEHQGLIANKFEAASFRQKWFREHRIADWEADVLREMQVEHHKYPFIDEYHAYCAYRIGQNNAKWLLLSDTVADKVELSNLNNLLDDFYLRAKLECFCHIANQALVAGIAPFWPEKEEISRLIEQRRSSLKPTYLIWEKAWILLQEPKSLEKYYYLKGEILLYGHLLSKTENHTIYLYLMHSARFTITDSDQYFRELMQLYQLQIESDCLFVEGYLHPNTFFNIISVANRLKLVDWATNFYDRFVTALDPASEKTDPMRLLSKAILQFEQKQFHEVLTLLNATKFRDIQTKLTERRLRLKTYLELGYEDLFLDQTNTFRKFLSVNQKIIPNHHYTGNIAFIRAALLIHKVQNNDAKSKKDLVLHISESQVLPEKHWIEQFIQ
jgi:hypothetical protein